LTHRSDAGSGWLVFIEGKSVSNELESSEGGAETSQIIRLLPVLPIALANPPRPVARRTRHRPNHRADPPIPLAIATAACQFVAASTFGPIFIPPSHVKPPSDPTAPIRGRHTTAQC
jgi:hypothetical protein